MRLQSRKAWSDVAVPEHEATGVVIVIARAVGLGVFRAAGGSRLAQGWIRSRVGEALARQEWQDV